MATTNISELNLLIDYIKLSLLERQRAISLNLDPNSNDGQISRSLDQLQSGISALESQSQWDDPLHPSSDQQEYTILPCLLNASKQKLTHQPSRAQDQLNSLKTQYTALLSNFHASSSNTTLNDPILSTDSAEQTKPSKASKSVRFTDSPDDPNRSSLFPAHYTDDPSDSAVPDQSNLTNEQINTYHTQVIRSQDEQLDRLGESITRQRDLSIQIGDELDNHALMLDEVDERVDRHQSTLDRARNRLGRIAKGARDQWGLTCIVALIIILVVLIIITKR
jgi:syntaxin 8